jgi:hypothetical protein
MGRVVPLGHLCGYFAFSFNHRIALDDMSGPDTTATESNSVIWPALWSAFEPHRQRIFELLRSSSTNPNDTLCVWGAGRTTDLDLIRLLDFFSEIDLVDLQPALTRRALTQRGFDDIKRVSVLPAMDLTGLSRTREISQRSSESLDLKSIIDLMERSSLNLRSYNVVVSTCVLSQILSQAQSLVPEANARETQDNLPLVQIIRALREQHLRLLLEHVHPGGFAILVTDLTSSEALPDIRDANFDANRGMKSVFEGNHFHGLNPNLIVESAKHPAIAEKLEDIRVSAPWVWDSIEMQYLCIAVRMQKRA